MASRLERLPCPRLLCLPLAGLILVLACGAASAREEDLDALLSRAVVLHQSGDLAGAAALYVQVLRARPEASHVRSNLGAAYAGLGRYEEAVTEYGRALAAEDDPSIRLNLALAEMKAGHLEAAADDASRVLVARPADRNAALVLADLRLRLGQNDRLVELLQPMAAANPDDKSVAYVLGTALLNLGRADEAQALLDRVFRDDSPEGHVLLGAMLAHKGDAAAALAEYQKALAANPKMRLVNFLSGQCLMERSDWAGAADAFRRELAVDPDHYESNLMLGNLLRKEAQYDEALRHLTHAARLNGSDPALKFALGATYLAVGRTEEALPLLEAVRAAVPDHVPTHMQLALAYLRLGRTQDAAQERAAVVKLEKEAESRSFDGARKRLDEVLGKTPPAPDAAPQAARKPSP
jgi:protein O-GlcNAc transferase